MERLFTTDESEFRLNEPPVPFMQSIESKKKDKNINMPLQKKQIINIIEKFEKHQRLIQQQAPANAEMSSRGNNKGKLKNNANIQVEDSPSRSSSIQGRKLSYCDPQITVSQHTLENHHGNNQECYSHRDQRVSQVQQQYSQMSSLQPLVTNSNNQFQSFVLANQVHHPATIEQMLVPQLPLTSSNIMQVSVQAAASSRRGNHNPRQSKETQGKKKLRKSIGNGGQQQSQQNRHLYSIRPTIQNRPTSSISRVSVQNQSHTDISNKTPSRERKSNISQNGLHHSQSQGQITAMNRQQLILKAVSQKKLLNPTGFQVTFNHKNKKKNLEPVHFDARRQIEAGFGVIHENVIDKPFQIMQPKRPNTALTTVPETRIRKVERKSIGSNSGSKQRLSHRGNIAVVDQYLQARSQSPTPQKRNSDHNLSSVQKKRPHTVSTDKKSQGGSPVVDRQSSVSIDRLVKDNIKRQSMAQKEKMIQMKAELIEQSQRKKMIHLQNQKIRDRNQLPVQKQSIIELQLVPLQKQLEQDESIQRSKDMPMILKSHIARQSFKYNKNTSSHAIIKYYDEPKQLEARELPPQKKKYDLGLEIFELKKELGMGRNPTSSRGDMSNRNNLEDKKLPRNRRQNSSFDLSLHKNGQQESDIKHRKHANSASADRRSSRKREHSGCSTYRKRKENEMKKLVIKQQKEWLKKEKQQKISELMQQQKVLHNLKQLNQITEAKRINVKKNGEPKPLNHKPSSHFKTVDEMVVSNNDGGAHASYNKKKKIVNIKVKPESHKFIKDKIQFVAHPSTTKDQPKQIIKFKVNASAIKNKRESIHEKPKTQGILRISVDNSENVNDKKNRVLFSHVINNKENNLQINKSHHSILTDRSDLKHLKPSIINASVSSKKKKDKNNKNKLIIQLMRQIQEHQKEIQQLKHNYSMVSLNQKSTSKEKAKEPQKQLQAQTMNKSQSQIIKPLSQSQDEKVVIEDDMMIFCVLTTAASIIQKKYREYRLRKQQQQKHPLILKAVPLYPQPRQTNEESKNASQVLSESTKLEDRFLAVNNKKEEVKTVKHTFSFGHNEDINPQFKSSTAMEGPPSKVDTSIDMPQIQQLPSIPLTDSSNLIEQSKESSKLLPSSSEKEEPKIEQLLKINDKFKFALRNLAEKQKHSNALLDQLNKKKQQQRPQSALQDKQIDQPLQIKERPQTVIEEVKREEKYFIKDNNHEDLMDEPSMLSDFIIVPTARDQQQFDLKDLIDISRLSIEPIEEDEEQPALNVNDISLQIPQEEINQDLNSRQNIKPAQMFNSNQSNLMKSSSDHMNQNEYNFNSQHEESKQVIENDYEDEDQQKLDPVQMYNELDINEQLNKKKYQSQRTQSQETKRKLVEPNPFEYMSANPNKKILRNIFGDEKFLQEHYYDFNKPSQQASPHSASQKLMSSINKGESGQIYNNNDHHHQFNVHPFLATNSSIFERNPFHDFTTNKLHEILQSKNLHEVLGMREDAMKYHEHLENGYLNRLETKKQVSPKRIHQRKYDLERWVSAQKKDIELKKQHPVNLFDLESERREAALIIQRVNQKARDIKNDIAGSPEKGPASMASGAVPQSSSTSQLNIAIEEAKSSEVSDFINKQLLKTSSNNPNQLQLEVSKNEEDDEQVIDLTFEELPPAKPVDNEISIDENIILDISHMDDEFLISSKQPSLTVPDLPIPPVVINLVQLQWEKKSEEFTNQILNEILLKEIMQMSFVRKSIEEPPKSPSNKELAEIDYDQIKEIKSDSSPLIPENVQRIMEEVKEEIKSQQEIISQSIIASQVPEPQQEEPQKPVFGIDTSENAIEQYIEEIFEQIRPRKDQFLQAFITPIFKNPLEVLSQLQKPDFGLGGAATEEQNAMNLLDATNSLAYILNVQLYLTLEKAKENLIMETIEQIRQQYMSKSGRLNADAVLDDEMADLMSEAQHIHNKVIFDCVNEGLNMVRPYSNQGEPMLWSKKPRRNLIFLFDSADDLDKVLLQVKSTVVQWAHTKAGALSDKPHGQLSNEDPIFNSRRERVLTDLLSKELIRDEEKWLDYEMEEAQVKIDLSDIILEQLVGETVDVLNKLKSRDLQQS